MKKLDSHRQETEAKMHAKDSTATVERLTSVIGPKLARDRASFHINVQPAVDEFDLQPRFASQNGMQHRALVSRRVPNGIVTWGSAPALLR